MCESRFVGVGGLHDRALFSMPTNKLKADRQAVVRKSARQVDPRTSAKIHWRGKGQQGRDIVRREHGLRREVFDRHGRGGHSRAQQHIHLLQRIVNQTLRVLAGNMRFDVVGTGDFDPVFQERPECGSVFIRK